MVRSFCFLIVFVMLVWALPAAGITISSTWDLPGDRDGWICGNSADGYTGVITGGDPTAAVSWDPLNGGCLRLDDPAIQAGDFFIAAPQFLGDWSTGYSGGSITFDYKKSAAMARMPEIWIVSGADRWAAYTVFPSYADTEWHTYMVSLDAADWVHVDSGNPTTWEATLMNVTDFGILGDLKIGTETTYLDNVSLTLRPIPAPGAFLLVVLGTGVVASLRKS